MKKINFTKKSVSILIVTTLVCLFIEPTKYYSLYSNSFDGKWGGIIFSVVGTVIILSAKSYFPDRPKSLRRWLYFMAIAFSLEVLGQLVFKVYTNTSFVLLFYGVATLFFLLSLLTAIVTYKNTQSTSEGGRVS